MDKKKVVVLLSTYNGEQYVEEQIDSILNQNTSHQVDLIIRDDGSQDQTLQILKNYETSYPSRVKVFYEDNIGYIRSFFELIKKAGGYDYYALSDQDDIWLEDKLDIAVKMCEECEYDGPLLYGSSSFLVNGNLEIFGETQKQLREMNFYNVMIQNFLPGHAQVFNDKLCKILKQDIDYSKIYVHDFWITYMATLYGKVIFDNNSHTLYRQHGENSIGFGKNTIEWFSERLKRIKKSDSKKIAAQMHFFYENYHSLLKKEEEEELIKFIKEQKNFLRRMRYVFTTKMYRQKTVETFLFKMLYLVGGYKI